MPSALFSPTRLAGLELANRIVVSPMCQYSADDGVASDWHLNHLGMLANSGAALVVVEATGVERRGRITHGCLGIYSDDCEAALARVVAHCRRYGTAKLGIQIGHAGRKASASRPWEGSRSLAAGRRPLGDHRAIGDPVRPELACAARDDRRGHGAGARGLRRGRAPRRPCRVRRDRTACRARLSPAQLRLADLEQAHRRVRRHAGRTHALSARGRARRCARPCRQALPLGARITGDDWIEGGLTPNDAVTFAKALKADGLDFVCISSGGVSTDSRPAQVASSQRPVCRKGQAGGRHLDAHGRADLHAETGRSHRRGRQGRHGGAGARLPRQSALGAGTPRNRSAPTFRGRRSTSAPPPRCGPEPATGTERNLNGLEQASAPRAR